MADLQQPNEGYASVQYKLILPHKQTLEFNQQVVTFVSAEIADDVYGGGTGLHTFRTLDPNFLESVKQAMSSADPVMEFRLGFGSPNQTYWLPWQQHIIVTYSAMFEGIANTAGHLLVFNTSNVLFRMERANQVRSHKGTISNIVSGLAVANKLEAVIEPTDAAKYILFQSFQNDAAFIRQRLTCRAIRRGRAGYYFYIRDNVLHFHTPDYQTSVRQLNYYQIFGTELVLSDMSQDPKLWDAGLSGVRVIAHDPYSGQTKEFSSDPNKAMRLADSIYAFSSIVNGERNIPYHASQNPSGEIDAMAQAYYQIARQQTFRTTVSVDKNIVLRHGDLLNLSVTQQNSKATSHSGYYYVTAASHFIKKQSVRSVYRLERGELRGQDQSFTAQNAQEQLIPLSNAPGEFPNIREAQDSQLTKGAGRQSSASTYSVVQNPNG